MEPNHEKHEEEKPRQRANQEPDLEEESKYDSKPKPTAKEGKVVRFEQEKDARAPATGLATGTDDEESDLEELTNRVTAGRLGTKRGHIKSEKESAQRLRKRRRGPELEVDNPYEALTATQEDDHRDVPTKDNLATRARNTDGAPATWPGTPKGQAVLQVSRHAFKAVMATMKGPRRRQRSVFVTNDTTIARRCKEQDQAHEIDPSRTRKRSEDQVLITSAGIGDTQSTHVQIEGDGHFAILMRRKDLKKFDKKGLNIIYLERPQYTKRGPTEVAWLCRGTNPNEPEMLWTRGNQLFRKGSNRPIRLPYLSAQSFLADEGLGSVSDTFMKQLKALTVESTDAEIKTICDAVITAKVSDSDKSATIKIMRNFATGRKADDNALTDARRKWKAPVWPTIIKMAQMGTHYVARAALLLLREASAHFPSCAKSSIKTCIQTFVDDKRNPSVRKAASAAITTIIERCPWKR
jgi:hypothetical protein